MLEKPHVWPLLYEETPDKLKHRYFHEDGSRVSDDELRHIEEAWKNSAAAHAGVGDFRKSLEPRRPKDVIPGE